jgi:hypothetical protein
MCICVYVMGVSAVCGIFINSKIQVLLFLGAFAKELRRMTGVIMSVCICLGEWDSHCQDFHSILFVTVLLKYIDFSKFGQRRITVAHFTLRHVSNSERLCSLCGMSRG